MKAFKIVVTVLRALSVIGLVIGVVFIVFSYHFNSTFEDFRKNGVRTSGVITDLYDNGNLRYTSYFVDVDYSRFNAKGRRYIAKAQRVEVYFKAARDLHTGETIALYYKKNGDPSDVLLAINYDNQYVPLSRKPFWGWGITITSALVLLSYRMGRLFKKMKKQ